MTTTISLSSNTIPISSIVSPLSIIDVSNIIIDLTNISQTILPKKIRINWGDLVIDEYENDLLLGSVFDENFSPVLKNYEHTYYPPASTIFSQISAIIDIIYLNNNVSTFTIPIHIANDTYDNAIDDLLLINTIFSEKYKIHQFVSKKDGYLIELKTSG